MLRVYFECSEDYGDLREITIVTSIKQFFGNDEVWSFNAIYNCIKRCDRLLIYQKKSFIPHCRLVYSVLNCHILRTCNKKKKVTISINACIIYINYLFFCMIN